MTNFGKYKPQKPQIMKRLFVILMALISFNAMSQKKMKLIPGYQTKIDTIGVEATPRFVTESQAMVISQNNRDVFEFDHPDVVEKDVQYFFVLEVDPTTKGQELRKAKLIDFTVSPRQSYRFVNQLKTQYNLKE